MLTVRPALNRLVVLRLLALLLLAGIVPNLRGQQAATSVSPATPTFIDTVTGVVTIPGMTGASGTVDYSVDGGPVKTARVVNGSARINLGSYAKGGHVFTTQSIMAGGAPVAAPPPAPFTVTDQAFSFVGASGFYYANFFNATVTRAGGLAVDSHDKVYVSADSDLITIDVSGNIVQTPTSTFPIPVVNPTGLAFDAAGNLYIGDMGNQRVVKMTPSGAESVLPIPGLGKPGQLAIDRTNQLLYILDRDNYRVLRFDLAAGALAGTEVGGSTLDIRSIAVAPNGDFLWADYVNGFFRISRTTGFTTQYFVPHFDYAGGIYADREGNVYCSDIFTNAVWRIDPTGHQTQISDGGIPTYGTAEDSQGRIFLFANGSNMRIFAPFGSLTNSLLSDSRNGNPGINQLVYTMPSGMTGLSATASPSPEFTAYVNDEKCDSNYGTCNFGLDQSSSLPGMRVGNVQTTLTGGPTISTPLYGNALGSEPAFIPGTPAQTPTGAVTTSGVALDEAGNYYASDATGNQVFETTAGVTRALGFSGLSRPTSLAVDGSGGVYVLDSGNQRVVKLDAAGNQTAPVTAGSSNTLSAITAFTIDGGGQIYFAGPAGGGGAIYSLSRAGAVSQVASGLGSIVSLVRDPYANFYVLQADGSVVRIDLLGNQTTVAAAGTFENPVGLAVDASDTAYVLPAEAGTVTLVHPDGTTLTIPVPSVTNATGMAIDGRGSVLAADAITNQFTYVDRSHQDFNFGDVPVNTTKTFTAYYANSGTQPFHLEDLPGNNDFVQVTTPDACESSTATTNIAAASSCNLSYTTTPTRTGLVTDYFRVTSDASLDFDTFTANGVASATLTLAPSLDFGSVAVGTTSTKTLTLTNHSTAAVTLNGGSVTGEGFQDAPGNCGSSIAAGAACNLGVSFTPAAQGGSVGTYTLSTGAGAQSATLTGTGVTASATLSTTSYDFGPVVVGTTTPGTVFTLINTGGTPLTVTSLTIGGAGAAAYAIVPGSSTCGTAFAPNTSCSFAVTFSPSSQIAYPATVSLVDQAGMQTLTLHGTGVQAPYTASISPASFNFGNVTDGTQSATQAFVITNTGTGTYSVNGITTGSGFVVVSNTCQGSLAPGANCQLNIAFNPSNPGLQTSSIVLTTGPTQLSQQTQVTMSGTGVAPTYTAGITPASFNFGSVVDGTQSAMQAFVITNTGTGAYTVNGITTDANFAVASNTCKSSLAPGASCQLNIAFSPSVPGLHTSNIVLTTGPTQLSQQTQVTMSGTGIAATYTASITPASFNFGNVAVGSMSPTQAFVITNTGTATYSVNGITTDASFVVASNSCQSSLVAGASCQLNIAFSPSKAGLQTSNIALTTGPVQLTQQTQVTMTGTGGTTAAAGSTASITVPAQTFVPGAASSPLVATVTYSGAVPNAAVAVQVDGGQALNATCNVQVGGGAMNCDVQYPTAGLSAAAHTITVSLLPDGVYAATQGSGALTPVAMAKPQVAITVPAQTVAAGTTTVPVTAIGTFQYGVFPTQTTVMTVDGIYSMNAACTLLSYSSASCTAQVPTPGLSIGVHTIAVTINGDANYSTSYASGTLTVQ